MVNDHGGAGVGLAAIADAVLSEVVALHIHLENLSRREGLRQSYLDKGLKAAGINK
jgi:3-dehydroquinate dehydratase